MSHLLNETRDSGREFISVVMITTGSVMSIHTCCNRAFDGNEMKSDADFRASNVLNEAVHLHSTPYLHSLFMYGQRPARKTRTRM